jgi:hypothetical protein
VLAHPLQVTQQLRITEHWGRTCLGYLLVAQPDLAAATAFTAVQDRLLALEPVLLRQPAYALHVTAGLLVPVLSELDRPKDEIWREHGPSWTDAIASAAASTQAGPLRFRQLLMTDAAIIAVAEEPNPVSELRRALNGLLDLPWPLAKGELVHCTLFRYRDRLARSEELSRGVRSVPLAVDTDVTEVLIARTTTFPFLDFDVCHRIPLGRPLP